VALTIDLLGPTRVAVDGVVVTGGGPRERAVLAVLALRHCTVVSPDVLLDVVWPDGLGSRGSLHVHVHNLRDRFGSYADHLTRAVHGYRLDGPDLDVDTDRFGEQALLVSEAAGSGDTAAVVEHARAAEALFRGELCEDLPELDLTAERQAYDEQRLSLVEQRIEAELSSGRADPIVELEALLARHPYRERLWGLLMVALYRASRQTDALAAYRRAREALLDGVGVEPGAVLKAVERAVLAQQDPMAPLLHAAPAESSGPVLLWLDAHGLPRRVPLPARGDVMIGRLDEAHVRLETDDTVSRRHATIRRVGRGWELSDLGSMNGTLVNGLRVSAAVPLVPGDLIRCGSTALLLTQPANASRPADLGGQAGRTTQRLRSGPPVPAPRSPAQKVQRDVSKG
jgi:DNA-binding SARP family transcriptional activator